MRVPALSVEAFSPRDEARLHWKPGIAIYAARTVTRNLSTSILRRLLSLESDCADDSTCEEAEPVSLAPAAR
jgi:hypothetical protein